MFSKTILTFTSNAISSNKAGKMCSTFLRTRAIFNTQTAAHNRMCDMSA